MTYQEFIQRQGTYCTVNRANSKRIDPFRAKLVGTEAGLLILVREDGSRYWAESYNVSWN